WSRRRDSNPRRPPWQGNRRCFEVSRDPAAYIAAARRVGVGDGPRGRTEGVEPRPAFSGWYWSASVSPGDSWSGRRDSNPRPPPWQGGALPTEPRPRATHLRSQRTTLQRRPRP